MRPAYFRRESRFESYLEGIVGARLGRHRKAHREADSNLFRGGDDGTPTAAEEYTIRAGQQIRHSATWQTVFACWTWGENLRDRITSLPDTAQNGNRPMLSSQEYSFQIIYLN